MTRINFLSILYYIEFPFKFLYKFYTLIFLLFRNICQMKFSKLNRSKYNFLESNYHIVRRLCLIIHSPNSSTFYFSSMYRWTKIKSIIFQDPIEKDRFDSSTFHFTIRTNVFSVKIIESIILISFDVFLRYFSIRATNRRIGTFRFFNDSILQFEN